MYMSEFLCIRHTKDPEPCSLGTKSFSLLHCQVYGGTVYSEELFGVCFPAERLYMITIKPSTAYGYRIKGITFSAS